MCFRPRRFAVGPGQALWNVLVTGIGGTGVVTIGALLGMAGHLEGKGATVLDQTGLAQKGGAVTSHIRIGAGSRGASTPCASPPASANLVLGCDMVVVNDYWVLSKIRPERSTVVMNTYEAMPGTFTTRPDMQFPAAEIVEAVSTALDGEAPLQVDATQIATALMGDAIAANLFMLGYAWQQGLVPISFDALMRAIELNGAAMEMNKTAFAWGRLAVVDLGAVIEAAGIVRNAPTAAELTAHRCRCWARPTTTPFRADPVRGNLRSEDELRHVPANAGRCRLPAAGRRAPVAFAG
jgi:indolepyruvate ferredoxin oxidoreductase